MWPVVPYAPPPFVGSGDVAGIDPRDRLKKFDRLGLGALKGIATDDRPESAAVSNGPCLFKHVLVLALGAAGEYDDAPAGKRALHDMPHPFRERLDRNLLRFVHFLGRCLFEVLC